MSAISHLVWHSLFSINVSINWDINYQLQLVCPTRDHCPMRNLQHETSNTFDTFDQSWHLPHTLHKSFFFFCIFNFLEIMKHNMPKCLIFSSIFNIKMNVKIHQFFLNACWYDSCFTIQSNEIILNGVKDNWELVEPSYKEKNKQTFWPTQ